MGTWEDVSRGQEVSTAGSLLDGWVSSFFLWLMVSPHPERARADFGVVSPLVCV